ncbi:MAG TPA: antibiotic biosynthesis monooxygenase [Candidatus Acidoferrales bacterium]|nr:antibiotic biosynthesis monooxygenase [Candidatus Acidoferrales bacterium]
MAEHAELVHVSRYHPDSQHRDRFLEVAKSVSAESRSTVGCFGAQVCTSSLDDAVVVISRWDRPASLTRWLEDARVGSLAGEMSTLGGEMESEELRSL